MRSHRRTCLRKDLSVRYLQTFKEEKDPLTLSWFADEDWSAGVLLEESVLDIEVQSALLVCDCSSKNSEEVGTLVEVSVIHVILLLEQGLKIESDMSSCQTQDYRSKTHRRHANSYINIGTFRPLRSRLQRPTPNQLQATRLLKRKLVLGVIARCGLRERD